MKMWCIARHKLTLAKWRATAPSKVFQTGDIDSSNDDKAFLGATVHGHALKVDGPIKQSEHEPASQVTERRVAALNVYKYT